jgi:gas vesicle protein
MSNQDNESGRDQKNSVVPALLGFTAGAIVGAVTALLYAPQPGDKTREKIREHVSDMSTKASGAADRTREAFEEAKDKVLSAYEGAVEKTTNAIETAKDKLGRKKDSESEEV